MSISRGRYVACFRRPFRDWNGRKVGLDGIDFSHANFWSVCLREREGRVFSVEYSPVIPFQTFAEAKRWAIERLDELTMERV